MESRVPPGFRFHPTDEELVDYYLRKKIKSQSIDLDVIHEVDLYKIEPWELSERCQIGFTDEQNEWYFFSHKDKKYPTGSRTNRSTAAGFWKATGRDKAIYGKQKLLGMRKTLVFYIGRSPNGQKTDWIMHEYRLENYDTATSTQETGWAVCRVFRKKCPNFGKSAEMEQPGSRMRESTQTQFDPFKHFGQDGNLLSCKQELPNMMLSHLPLPIPLSLPLPLPPLESPTTEAYCSCCLPPPLPAYNCPMPLEGIRTVLTENEKVNNPLFNEACPTSTSAWVRTLSGSSSSYDIDPNWHMYLDPFAATPNHDNTSKGSQDTIAAGGGLPSLLQQGLSHPNEYPNSNAIDLWMFPR